ncbi:unnamed protein product [Peronospora belbahrii]|uniref:FHA domain-containing protein n=1 Tax=Peronospora belbahrii TaxID=622444 RepID=A0ABN8D233_9STRA|nr:unnamed protein product [Peronospora belbahrii]
MDLTTAWQELARFQETSIATSAHIYANTQEHALVQDFLTKVPVATLFACLQDASDRGSDKEVKQVCTCINRVLSSEDDGTSLFFQPDMVPYLLAGLTHAEKEVKVLVVNQFIAHVGRKPSLDQVKVVADPLVLEQVCSVVAEEDIEVAAKASKVLEMLSSIPDSEIYQEILNSLKSKAQRSDSTENSIEFMRYLETIVTICRQDDEHMKYGISLGAIDLVLNCLQSNDPLLLMNIVDLLPVVCETKIGVRYIFESGTLKTLLTMTKDSFVGDNAIRLVGEISATAARLNIETWSWSDAMLSKAFMETIESKLQSTDTLQQIAVMDALAAFGSSSDKELQFLLQHRSICQMWLQLGSSTKIPVKTNCFHSIGRVLGAHTRLAKEPTQVPDENAGVWSMCERLFNSLGAECAQQSTMLFLMNTLKQPFEELRTSVFHVLRSTAAQNSSWGIRVLLSYGGFFEFLLDRTTEPTKETREWKFAVLDAVLTSPFQSQLDASLLENLKASMRRGPYAGATAPVELTATFPLKSHDDIVDKRLGEQHCVMEDPGRAAFLCSNTAAFHPPLWACMPIETNSHARLDAFRDGRHCATYMVATQRVNLFGRDQGSCDHVLGNPSVSRKHAAVIHDNEGGIYIVDLMSRHGTYVGRKKIPPHDPYLIHDGDVIRFGQSVRVYILKGAGSDGNSAPVKKSWGRKIRVPRVSISAVVPKRNSSKPKASSAVTKLVNAVCYGALKDEKVVNFITGVLELGDKDRQGVADTLVERLQAKFEFYATHVHRNAFVATMALLKQNLCVEEFEENLDVFTHISQQRNDNIYRADARKLLQAIAAVRLDPDNPQFIDVDSTEEDVGSACPVTVNNREGRERSISEEGNKLEMTDHGILFPGRTESARTVSESGMSHRGTISHNDSRYQMSHYPSSIEYDGEESTLKTTSNGYAPPNSLVVGSGKKQPIVNSEDSIGFSFVAQSAPAADKPNESAFGFIAGSDPVDDTSSRGSSTDRPSGQFASGIVPQRPSVSADNFLVEYPSVDSNAFEDMWELANDESEEWSVDLGSVDAHELDPRDLQACLQPYRMKCVFGEKVAGQQHWFFVAEQVGEGTLFLVNISVMPGLSDMSVTLKWIVNSLLYRNGHVIFMEILKYALHQFAEQVQVRAARISLPSQQVHCRDRVLEPGQNHATQLQRNGRDSEVTTMLPASCAASQYAPRTASHATSRDDGDDVEDADEEAMSARDYLCESPVIDAGKFEQVWATATEIASLSYSLNDLPEVDEVIELFRSNCMSCLASGSVDKLVKFFFFAEMTEIQCVFCVEMSFGVDTGALEGTVKRLAIRRHSEEEEEQIDSSFISFIEEVIQNLDAQLQRTR